MHIFVSFLDFLIILQRKRELVALRLLSYGGLVTLPHGVLGSSAVCDCGNS